MVLYKKDFKLHKIGQSSELGILVIKIARHAAEYKELVIYYRCKWSHSIFLSAKENSPEGTNNKLLFKDHITLSSAKNIASGN